MNTLELPKQMPVMVLPMCTFLPHGLLPLYIFEEKYREMLRHALSDARIFALAMRRGEDEDDADAVATVGTAGMIRACVRNPDGTSHLLLQGLRRVEFLRWHDDSPFPLADARELVAEVRDPETCQRRAVDLVRRACALSKTHGTLCDQLRQHLADLDDPEPVADIVAYNFIRCPAKLQEIVEEPLLDERLNRVERALMALEG